MNVRSEYWLLNAWINHVIKQVYRGSLPVPKLDIVDYRWIQVWNRAVLQVRTQ